MKITRAEQAGIEVVTISGRVSGSEVPALAGEFQAIRSSANLAAPARLVLDVGDLDNLPSAVVGSFIEAVRAMEAVGGRLVLAAPSHALGVILDRLGIGQLVSSFKTVEEARRALSANE